MCGGPLGPCPGEVSPSRAQAGQTPSPTPVPSGSGGGGGGTNSGSGEESGHKSEKLSGGAIAGIAVGSALGAALLLFLLVYLCRRSGGTRTRSLEMPPPAPAPAAAAGGRKAPEMTSGAAVAQLTTIGHPNARARESELRPNADAGERAPPRHQRSARLAHGKEEGGARLLTVWPN